MQKPAGRSDSSVTASFLAGSSYNRGLRAGSVLEIEEEIEIRQWTVETRQGKRSFQTHLDDWPRVLPSGGLLIRDVAGDLYKLADPNGLDRKSRALLWAFVD